MAGVLTRLDARRLIPVDVSSATTTVDLANLVEQNRFSQLYYALHSLRLLSRRYGRGVTVFLADLYATE